MFISFYSEHFRTMWLRAWKPWCLNAKNTVFFSFVPTGFSCCFSMFPGLRLLFTSRRSPAISGPILSCRLQRRCADVSVVVSWHHAAVLHVAGCLWGPIPTHGAETDELKLDIVGRWKRMKKAEGADSQPGNTGNHMVFGECLMVFTCLIRF